MKRSLSALGVLTLTVTLLLAYIAFAGAPFMRGWPAIAWFPLAVLLVVATIVTFIAGFSLTLYLLLRPR